MIANELELNSKLTETRGLTVDADGIKNQTPLHDPVLPVAQQALQLGRDVATGYELVQQVR